MNLIQVPVFLSSCSPNEITGMAEAKNMYVVGAKILGTNKQVVLETLSRSQKFKLLVSGPKTDIIYIKLSEIKRKTLPPHKQELFYI